MTPICDAFYAFSRRLNTAVSWVAGLCFAAMLIVVMLQVVARYIFASPPFWTEELARWLMVWGGLLGASVAFHTHADPAMIQPPPENLFRQKLQIICRFVAAWIFFPPVIWYAFPFVERQFGRMSEGMGVSNAWMVTALPVAAAIICLHALAGLGALISARVLDHEIDWAREAATHDME